jgi:glycine/D-amino acid oxidase-like deaminating enzyme
MPEWATTLLAVVVGALITGAIAEYRARKDKQERYKVAVFEKRLQAHQQAYSWCQHLTEVLNVGNVTGTSSNTILTIAVLMREWWNDNCLLLDADSRNKMLELLNQAQDYADGKESGQGVWSTLHQCKKALVAGIGEEYLPKTVEMPNELKDVM